MTDVALANAWFYGDLVHADQTQIGAAAAFDIGDRFAAAAVRTAQIALMARGTLSSIKSLIDDGMIDLDSKVLEDVPVKVEPKTFENVDIYTAPVGTEPPGPASQQLEDTYRPLFPAPRTGTGSCAFLGVAATSSGERAYGQVKFTGRSSSPRSHCCTSTLSTSM